MLFLLCYIIFCSQAKLVPISTNEVTLLVSVTHLANQELAYSTIKVYPTAVHSAQVAEWKHNTFESQLTLCLQLTNISKSPRVCLPVIGDILQGINTVLSAKLGSYFNKMMWAACYMAVFVFLCSSEFTVPPSITTTLKYICHSQISHWIEGASLLWCVYILSSPN